MNRNWASIIIFFAVFAAGCASDESTDLTAERLQVFVFDTPVVPLGQEATVECMKKEGFEFWPDVSAPPQLEDESEADLAGTVGYGVATFAEEDLGTPSDTLSRNDEYLQTLQPREIEQYYITLFGIPPENFEGEWNETGCIAAGTTRAQTLLDAQFGEELVDVSERALSHPAVIEASALWSTCMLELGHNYQSPDDAVGAFYEALDDLADEYTDFGTEAGKRALAELADEERRVAVDDVRCSEPVIAAYSKVLADNQGQFVQTHRSALQELEQIALAEE